MLDYNMKRLIQSEEACSFLKFKIKLLNFFFFIDDFPESSDYSA